MIDFYTKSFMMVNILGIKSMTQVNFAWSILHRKYRSKQDQSNNATLGSSTGERLLEHPLLTPEPENGAK